VLFIQGVFYVPSHCDINKALREDNWIIKKIDDEWHEFCSEKCLESFMNSNR